MAFVFRYCGIYWPSWGYGAWLSLDLIMIAALEDRLSELKKILSDLEPKSASESYSLEHLQMQTYILGFQDAAKIAIKFLGDKDERPNAI